MRKGLRKEQFCVKRPSRRISNFAKIVVFLCLYETRNSKSPRQGCQVFPTNKRRQMSHFGLRMAGQGWRSIIKKSRLLCLKDLATLKFAFSQKCGRIGKAENFY